MLLNPFVKVRAAGFAEQSRGVENFCIAAAAATFGAFAKFRDFVFDFGALRVPEKGSAVVEISQRLNYAANRL
jgi:hypothetical protein